MPERHKHADLIIAWANGASIQWRSADDQVWMDIGKDSSPGWWPLYQYRIKPEPKPDIVKYANEYQAGAGSTNYSTLEQARQWAVRYNHHIAIVKKTFDGETGKLKSVEVVVSAV